MKFPLIDSAFMKSVESSLTWAPEQFSSFVPGYKDGPFTGEGRQDKVDFYKLKTSILWERLLLSMCDELMILAK